MGPLSLLVARRPDVSLVPMGHAAAGDRFLRHLLRAAPMATGPSPRRSAIGRPGNDVLKLGWRWAASRGYGHAGGSVARVAALADVALAAALALVPADVPIGPDQTALRRSGVAQSDGADFSLRDTTTADLDRLVRAPTAAVVSKILLLRDLCHRGGRAVSVLRAAAAAIHRRCGHGVPPTAHRAHGKLQFLQSADDGAM